MHAKYSHLLHTVLLALSCVLCACDNASTTPPPPQQANAAKHSLAAIFRDHEQVEIDKHVHILTGCDDEIIGFRIEPKLQLTRQELKNIIDLGSIRILDIRGQDGLSAHFDVLARLQEVDTLSLSRSKMNDEDIEELKRLIRVGTLLMNDCEVSSTAVSRFLSEVEVNELHLNGCRKIDNTLCKSIVPLHSLSVLGISATQIDQEHLLWLHNQRPGLAIASHVRVRRGDIGK